MLQEIIVFILFAAIIGFYLYRFLFQKDRKMSGGCNKCADNRPQENARKKGKEV